MCIRDSLDREYGLVLEGGGAKGAYQIGAFKALREAGIKIKGISGTSVGALNGALICMGDLEKAEKIWENITYSTIMDVDDNLMRQFFQLKLKVKEFLELGLKHILDGGIDVTPVSYTHLDVYKRQEQPRHAKSWRISVRNT